MMWKLWLYRGSQCAAVALMGAASASAEGPEFRVHSINPDSEFCACAAVDVDRDGKLDVVAGGWWYQAPSWNKQPLRNVERIRGRFDDYSNLPIDVNGDSFVDLVSANYRSSKLAWIEHPGTGKGLWREHVVDLPGPMETARLYDVDGDGCLDVLPNGVQFAAWWEIAKDADGKPRWVRYELPAEVAGHGVGFGDVDGDGRGDVVGPAGWLKAPTDARTGRWLWNPEFRLHRDCSIPILVHDVDCDGDADLVWGRGHHFGLYWLEQVRDVGKRRWEQHAIDTSLAQLHSLLLVDLDNDGTNEVVAGRRYLGHEGRDLGEYESLGVYWFGFDRKTRTWKRGAIVEGGRVGFGLDPKAVDLDGDGDIDLLAPGRSGLYWLENLSTNRANVAASIVSSARPQRYPDPAALLVYRTADGAMLPVTNPFDWAKRRADILANMQLVMGPLPDSARRALLEVTAIKEEDCGQYIRKTITFVSEPGDRVPAYLLIPKGRTGRGPAVLCLHQTTKIGKGEPAGIGGLASLHYAHELAERGYVCLAPDYPSFGDYSFDFVNVRDRYPSGSMKAIWNNLRAVDLLESLPQVDPDRIGCIGHSLGGHNTMFTAVFDQRIRAMVSSCGFTAFPRYYGGKLAGWTSDRYMPRIRDEYGNDPSRVPFDFTEVVAAFAPRPFFINAPLHDSNFDVVGVKEVVAAAGSVYELLGAKDRLKVAYPDCGHDFPLEIRRQAYEALDHWLQ